MTDLGWALDLVLVGMLTLTLVHAVRLERALRLLRSDRTALDTALVDINESTRLAETGLNTLHATATNALQALSQQVERAEVLKDDLGFLVDRGNGAADRLDIGIRASKSLLAQPADPVPKVRSQAERDLIQALRGA